MLLKQKFEADLPRKEDGYKAEPGHIHQLNRREQTTVFSPRTGQCGPRKHMNRLELSDTASCKRGAEDQFPASSVQTCPHLEESLNH